MELYRQETKSVIPRFLDGNLTHAECVAALDAALAGVIPNLAPEELPEVRRVLLLSHNILIEELKRRGQRSVR